MELSKDSVQEFVDNVVGEYKDESILGNGVTVESDVSPNIPFNTCREETSVDADSLSLGTALMGVGREISGVMDCEEAKVVQNFDEEAESVESISADEFAVELGTQGISLPLSSDNRVLLPDHPDYKVALEQAFGTCDYVGGSDKPPVYYFDPDLFPQQGFVVSNQVFVAQEGQGSEYRLVNEDLGIGELADENSDNRLQMHIGDKGRFPINVALWSKFTDPRNIEEETLLSLDLPDPDQVLD